MPEIPIDRETELKKEEFKPMIPRGWTVLKHGTNLIKWGDVNPYTTDTIKVKGSLSAITQEEFEQSKRQGMSGTTKTYSQHSKPREMSEREFQQKNKPFEIRIIFYMDHARSMALSDPEYKKNINEETMNKIKEYYYINIQSGRHPVVPSKEVLIKLGQIQEDDRDVFYFVPESVAENYFKESGVKIIKEK